MSTQHLTEEDVVLAVYGELSLDAGSGRHLAECEVCQMRLRALERVLALCNEYDAPPRPGNYEVTTWAKLRPHIAESPAPQRWWRWFPAMAALVTVAFAGGMLVENLRHTPEPRGAAVAVAATSAQARERVLVMALSNHLDRTQMVLAELVNASAGGQADISDEQQRAEELLKDNRLLRQTALRGGDQVDANLLSDLERILLAVAHSPARISPPDLRQIQERIEEQGLLFKVRISETNLRQREHTL